MKYPKVSIVIPAYNHEKHVGEAIQSVLDQTFADFELIIINDGSTDDTEREILKFTDERIRYYSQENHGLSATLNRGIELARGEFFNFLPSDDAFFREKLEVQLKIFGENPEVGIVFSYPQLVDADGREIPDDPAAQWPIVPYETKEEIFPALFERNFLSAPTALIRMDCFKRVGLFDESLRYAQDYDLWMRILKCYDTRLVKQPLIRYRWHGQNLTFQATPETEMERERVLLKACKDLDVEEIFISLSQKETYLSYSSVYRRLADHMKKSGVSALIPISKTFEVRGDSLHSPLVNLPDPRDERENGNLRSRIAARRIHLLLETMSFDKGGLEQVVFNLAKGLDPTCFEVVIVAIKKGGYFAKRCKEIGIPVEILEHDRTREYQEVLERYQIDLVLSHYSTFGARLAFEKGIPSLSVIHNIYSWFPDNILTDFRSADPFVSGYIAVSEEVMQYAHYRFNIPLDRIVVIPNGIDIEEYFSRSSSKVIHRSELGLGEEDYVFVNVASIGPPKAQNVILAALDKVVRDYPQIKVISIGGVLDEAYASFLKERTEELQLSRHVKWIGSVEDARPYLQIADAFLLTSLIEGWPISVMEAMLHRLPLILTRVGGVREMLGDSGAGVLLNNNYDDFRSLEVTSLDFLSMERSPQNTEEVARAMKRLYNERSLWKEAGKKGYERVVEHFNLQRMISSYERELFSLHIAADRARGHRHLRKIAEQQRFLEENERVINDLRNQISRSQERMISLESKTDLLGGKMVSVESKTDLLGGKMVSVESKIGLLDAKIDRNYQNVDWKLDYVLARLSVKERVKGVIYRLIKKIHKLVPVVVREKYRKGYRKAFFDKVTPADQKLFLNQRGSSQGGGVSEAEEFTCPMQPAEGKNPIQDFIAFKEEIKRGLPLELKKLRTNGIPGLVSVVLPVYNQAYLLVGSIESVLQQTYSNLELIVVNDGSTDEIEKVLGPYRSHPRVKIVDQENQKLPRALSDGFRLARGEFFTWTSADNRMGKDQLEAQVEFLLNHPEVQMVYANYDLIDDQGSPLLHSDYCPGYQKPAGSNHLHLPRDLSELNAVRNNYIGPCFMYRGWVGKLVGDYDASQFTTEDYDYWLTINAFFRIEHLGKDEPFYFNRVHADSLTGRKKELKIVELTDRLMEFEKARRDFYRKKFNVYFIGNNEKLRRTREAFEANGNVVREFSIPSGGTLMEEGKVLGIWIASSVERGFVSRIMRENPHAFFVIIQFGSERIPDNELIGNFGMKAIVSPRAAETPRDESWFYAEDLSCALYPMLCKANIELFRRAESFDRWNP